MKKIIYLSGDEALERQNKVSASLEKLEAKLKESDELYIEVFKKEKNKKHPNLKKLERMERKRIRIKTQMQELKIELVRLSNGTDPKLNTVQRLIKKYKSMNIQKHEAITAYLLVAPFIVGLLVFFLSPLLQTIYWSFNDVTSIAGGLSIKWVGFKNFVQLFTVQTINGRTILEILTVSIREVLINVPVIFIFSLLVAVVLNSKFKGHEFFKVIFFIPVIYNTTVISLALSNGGVGSSFNGVIKEVAALSNGVENFLLGIGIGSELISFLIQSVDRIFTIVTKSGIQILIFIAALQSIPHHLYEAAKVEGATTFDAFCKITVPMTSKMFIPVIIYTIVDSFETSDLIVTMTRNSSGSKLSYGIQSSIAVIYFLINLVIIGLVYLIFSKVAKNNG